MEKYVPCIGKRLLFKKIFEAYSINIKRRERVKLAGIHEIKEQSDDDIIYYSLQIFSYIMGKYETINYCF